MLVGGLCFIRQLKLGELLQPSSKWYKSIGLTLLATTYCGREQPNPSGGRNQEEALEVDRTHIEESNQMHQKASSHMESSRPKEERKTKEQITLRNGDRHEKNVQELDGTRKEGP
ncbi:unnamed protein product [Schistosoma curassoni]|uniref:Ovule protein n=1 Tax=Schistosoma curassoni TaxID=6186 RepID=A0A183JXD1_9TREM|nr:unnamed protein product [Schistosoma curassoni]